MSSSRQAWFDEQRELEERQEQEERLKRSRVAFANKPEQLSLGLPVPHGYEVEKAYRELVEDCRNMPGWRQSEHYKTAARLGMI